MAPNARLRLAIPLAVDMLLGCVLNGKAIVCPRIGAHNVLRTIGSTDIGAQLVGYLLLRLVITGTHHIDATKSQFAQIGNGIGISI